MRPALPNGRWARALVLGAGAAVVAAAACSDVTSDPKVPFSIEFNGAPAPSVVLGEQMFDSLGIVAPLVAHVFNSRGDEIAGAAVTYHVVAYDNVPKTNPAFSDSVPLTVDAATGVVTGKSAPVYATKTARVYAQAGSLQSRTVIITATRHPDTLVAGGRLVDSTTLSFLNTDSLLVPATSAFNVRVLHTTGAPATAADSAVPAYLVRFRIVQPAGASTDTSYVMLTNGDRKRSELDTTDASGNASRQLRIRRVNFPFDKPASGGIVSDTIRVQASAYREGGQLVPGSPIEFRFVIRSSAH